MGAAEAVVVWHMLAMVKAHTCRRPPTNMWDTVEISMWSRGVEISPASSQRAVCCHSCCCCCGGFSPAFPPQHCPTIAPKGLPIGRCCGQRRRLNIAACRLEWVARPLHFLQPHHLHLLQPLHLRRRGLSRHVLVQPDQCQLGIPLTAQWMPRTPGERTNEHGVVAFTTKAAH